MNTRYESLHKLILWHVKRHRRRHGGDPDDLLSEINYQFHLATLRYRPECGEFKNFVFKRIHYCLKDHARERRREQNRIERYAEVVRRRERGKPFRAETLLEQLGKDGRALVELVLEMPIDIVVILREIGDESPQSVRAALREFLRDMGWCVQRIAGAVKEVKGALTR